MHYIANSAELISACMFYPPTVISHKAWTVFPQLRSDQRCWLSLWAMTQSLTLSGSPTAQSTKVASVFVVCHIHLLFTDMRPIHRFNAFKAAERRYIKDLKTGKGVCGQLKKYFKMGARYTPPPPTSATSSSNSDNRSSGSSRCISSNNNNINNKIIIIIIIAANIVVVVVVVTTLVVVVVVVV